MINSASSHVLMACWIAKRKMQMDAIICRFKVLGQVDGKFNALLVTRWF